MKKNLLIIPALLALCGCAGTVNTNPEKIIFTGNTGAGYVKNISVDETHSSSKELKKITVSGEAYSDATVYYSVVWFDKDNMKINTTMSKSVLEHLRKNQPFYWTSVAPNNKAESYKIFISDYAIQ